MIVKLRFENENDCWRFVNGLFHAGYRIGHMVDETKSPKEHIVIIEDCAGRIEIEKEATTP